jgi:hypothetical protein
VQINFANRLREFEAVSADGSALPTGTAIRVQACRQTRSSSRASIR